MLFLIAILFINVIAFAQDVENEYQTRTAFELAFKPVKRVKLSITPEFRFDENYALDKSLIEGEASYKAMKMLTFSGSYRFIANQRETKDTEYLNRYALGASLEKKIKKFETSFRLRYSNYSDDDGEENDFMRYKLSLKYDIPKCKVTPFVAWEVFQQLSNSEMYKNRFALGFDYKLFKKNSVGIDYKFDYYNNEYLNKHIVSIGYKLKF
ncbi:DUF2490 domain-containing protein [Plebeiibacterium marinum]|uniref:DUF2490 domain-containing protein n=1 Tax=Plebeiibacterium marinum TaxID=2992111 RepID=A0AAE3MBM3_9BACT|nr:DUF2490 domain-containing protein [Plebeiobacterium marinum]MCW3804903.1 DUF2490 domain-containing protein [Plebeiobacterium marinum]